MSKIRLFRDAKNRQWLRPVQDSELRQAYFAKWTGDGFVYGKAAGKLRGVTGVKAN